MLLKLFPSLGEATLTSGASNRRKWQMDIVCDDGELDDFFLSIQGVIKKFRGLVSENYHLLLMAKNIQ